MLYCVSAMKSKNNRTERNIFSQISFKDFLHPGNNLEKKKRSVHALTACFPPCWKFEVRKELGYLNFDEHSLVNCL